jgi:multidrug efflux pump subunit AcrA (membrane-fusion protein)
MRRCPIAACAPAVQEPIFPGRPIQAGQTVCFRIRDVSTVWIQGHILDRDLPSVRNGDAVEETNLSFNRSFHGAISYMGSSVDSNTRTTAVRVATGDPGGLLKKNMFVDAVIHTSLRNSVLVVPVAAVLQL